MLRRLATLGVLLLSLSGALPAALACAMIVQGADCCPTGQPCEPANTPAILVANGEPCCEVQPAAMRAVVAVSSRSDSRFDDSPAPDHSAVPAHEFPETDSSPIEPRSSAAVPRLQIDQQQTYLLTGRLRL